MEIKIITLNCFDSPLSLNRFARMNVIVSKILNLRPDVVFLQEITFLSTATIIGEVFKNNGYKVFYNANSVFNRGGLFTASLLPLDTSQFVRFTNQGKSLSLQLTDRILGKGYQRMTISIYGENIALFNVHLASVYNNSDREQKTLQDQLEQLVQELEGVKNKIICGDFNFPPKNSLYSKLLKIADLVDPLSDCDTITVSNNNSNRQGLYKNGSDVKLDYTFISRKIAKKIKSEIIFNKLFQINGHKIHLSDHFGLLTTLKV